MEIFTKVNLGENSLYGCEYFSQENVDKLNDIIQQYDMNN